MLAIALKNNTLASLTITFIANTLIAFMSNSNKQKGKEDVYYMIKLNPIYGDVYSEVKSTN
jgi:hypothetical protein